jgi:hypothetical protein
LAESAEATPLLTAEADTIGYAVIVKKDALNEFSILAVPGVPALGELAFAPNDEDINLEVTDPWIRIFDFFITRTGDTTADSSFDNTVKPSIVEF